MGATVSGTTGTAGTAGTAGRDGPMDRLDGVLVSQRRGLWRDRVVGLVLALGMTTAVTTIDRSVQRLGPVPLRVAPAIAQAPATECFVMFGEQDC